jgi:hypothetical protein
MIQDKAVTGSYVKRRELINYIEANFRTSFTYGWIYCFLQRRADEVRKAIVTPGELPRFQVPRQYLDHCINPIKKLVSFVPAELIFNLDETRLSDCEGSKLKPVLFQPISAIR